MVGARDEVHIHGGGKFAWKAGAYISDFSINMSFSAINFHVHGRISHLVDKMFSMQVTFD